MTALKGFLDQQHHIRKQEKNQETNATKAQKMRDVNSSDGLPPANFLCEILNLNDTSVFLNSRKVPFR
jgi:hypothetical protein